MRDWVWAIKEKKLRLFLPYGLALCLHILLIFLIAQHEAGDAVYVQDNSILVTLVDVDKFSQTKRKEVIFSELASAEIRKESQVATETGKSEVEPEKLDAEPKVEIEDLQTGPANDLRAESTAPLQSPSPSKVLPTKPSGNRLIPYNPRWRLKPGVYRPEADPVLGVLADKIDCFGFEVDCAAQRKELFKEQQMSERDKVWTQKYAHTGLPAEFYGLSEAEIRKRLNIPTAGQNGLVIIPGLLKLDGSIWDSMHGVNKSCKVRLDANNKETVKDCYGLAEKATGTKNYLSRKNSLDD